MDESGSAASGITRRAIANEAEDRAAKRHLTAPLVCNVMYQVFTMEQAFIQSEEAN